MDEYFKHLDRIPGFKNLLDEIEAGSKQINIDGLIGSSRALLAVWLYRKTNRTILFVSPDLEMTEKTYDDFSTFLGVGKAELYPSWEIQPYEIRAPHAENVGDRLKLIFNLQNNAPLICAPIHALIEPTIDLNDLLRLSIELNVGDSYDPDLLIERLVKMGYTRRAIVEQLGDFALRGGIIDVFPATTSEPVRIEFFGDEIESLRNFSVLSQRSLKKLKSAVILPLREILVDSRIVETAGELLPQDSAIALHDALGPNNSFDGLEFFRPLFDENKPSMLDFLPSDSIIVLDDHPLISSEMERFFEKAASRYSERKSYPFGSPHSVYIDTGLVKEKLTQFTNIDLAGFINDSNSGIKVNTSPQEPTGSHIKMLVEKLKEYKDRGESVTVFCDGDNQKLRLGELLDDFNLSLPLKPRRISEGFFLKDIGQWFLTDHEIFARARTRRKIRRFKEGIALSSYQSLQPGDFVVHIDFGIGKYKGLVTIVVDGRKRDCLLIFFAGNDKVYVPIEEFARVQKFGGKDGEPTLSRLGTTTWERTKARAKKGIMEMAKELIDLYAMRQTLSGFAFKTDTPWMMELEASFPYKETEDQGKAIDDIKIDMEKAAPMDRLVCGDVGYGKTEVAVRAAFKAVESGKQVAILVPTTILAQQHLNTFRERLEPFPVKIELLSRFRTAKESKLVKEGLKNGTVDIVIGTHKLLQKDIEFENLGLLVVDEEQRFGVTHKEKIKKLRSQVDCLTLTATPIPRTLQLSLLGARDMSLINTPPKDRLPINTEVSLFSEKIIVESIEREMIRGGQIFFVHNRVNSIYAIYRYLKKLIPSLRIIVGHGQMPEKHLERVMMEFTGKNYDLLLATAIIESGLDMPAVNTIIIDRADKLGLAQLYQLRGRVGRSSTRAFAHLLVPPLKLMKEKARKRLKAIEEFTELGSGFHLAMRDLEIRGAGNILGAQQHGFIEEVGFDLYCRLLEEAVAELKEIDIPKESSDIKIQTDLDLYVPENYIDDPNLRVEFYRNISELTELEKIKQLQDETSDRFGSYPDAVTNLFDLAYAKIKAAEIGAERISFKKSELAVNFNENTEPGKSDIERWRMKINYKMEFRYSDGFSMIIKLPDDRSDTLKKTLRTLSS